MKIAYKSFGKLNLLLKVLGFDRIHKLHKLSMVNTEIEIYDEIELELVCPGNGLIEIDMKPDSCTALKDNLIFKASIAYMEMSEFLFDAYFKVKKNIPIKSGLGGGSSNASYTLLELNRIFKKFSPKELMNIAFTIGCDLPFFIQGGLCRVEGFGEIIEPLNLPDFKNYTFVVVIPSFPLSTKEVYEKYDEISHNIIQTDFSTFIENIPIQNDLIYAAEQIEPQLKELILDLKKYNPVASSMTGSGSGCFAIFHEFEKAKALYEKIKEKYEKTFLARPKLKENI
jgi:4-diphosphocytidyl-2-C-methyl-D-erythritol kinase